MSSTNRLVITTAKYCNARILLWMSSTHRNCDKQKFWLLIIHLILSSYLHYSVNVTFGYQTEILSVNRTDEQINILLLDLNESVKGSPNKSDFYKRKFWPSFKRYAWTCIKKYLQMILWPTLLVFDLQRYFFR